MDRWLSLWMDRWMDGWTDRRTDGWMGESGWTDELLEK